MRLQINYYLRTGLIIIIEQGLKHTGEGYIIALVNTHRGYILPDLSAYSQRFDAG